MKRFLSVFLLLGGLVAAGGAGATTVYNETFTGVANGTSLNGVAPTVGQPWTLTGTQTVSSNAITVASNITAFAQFTNAQSSGTLTFTFDLSSRNCSTSGSGFAGISLFAGAANEEIFVGCAGSNFGYGIGGGGLTPFTGSPGTSGTVTVTYNYGSGAYTIDALGATQVSGTTTANLAIDRFRVGSNGVSSAQFTLTNFLNDFPVASAVPTLSEWAQLMLALMVIGVAWHFHNNRQNSY